MLNDFQIFLDTIAFVQGVILGLLLIALNRRKRKSSFFLGLFVLFFSLKLAYFIGRNLNLSGNYPDLLLLPFNFSWLLFPLFYLYTHQVSVFSNRKPPYWILVPGILFILVQVYIYFLPYETKIFVNNLEFHEFFHTYIGILYAWSIAIWNLKLLYQHRIVVRDTYSHIEKRELQWARLFLIYSIITSIVIHILYYTDPHNIYFKILYSVFDLIAIYWIAYHGITQRNIHSVIENKDYDIGFNRKLLNENSQKADADLNLQDLTGQIDAYISSSRIYTNKDLTIADLAENLEIHAKRISTAINTVHKQNFNSYVNRFRIENALDLLDSVNLDDFSIEGICNEVGFNSKSAFYAAFKKETGTTPTRYLAKKSA